MSAPNLSISTPKAPYDANIDNQNASGRNHKTARKLHGSFPKGDVRHWLPRVKQEDSADYGIQILFRGERHRFPLKTANKEAAARKALTIYQGLVAKGWDAILAEHKPQSTRVARPATIGEWLAEVKSSADFKLGTFTSYGQCLRQIAADIKDVKDQPALDEEGNIKRDKKKRIIYMSRFDYRAGGRNAWQSVVDALPLDIFTADAVKRWRLDYVKRAGSAPDARRCAENSASSLIRNARALFSEKARESADANLILPDPLPFAGVKLPKRGKTKYQSKIDAAELIEAAKKELTGAPLQIFTLGLMCGLRKREIDLLMWKQVDFTASQIRIERTEWFEPKSEESIGTVDIDPELLALLRGWKANQNGPFVIESTRQPRHEVSRVNYRCEPSFEELYRWLRAKGITANKPLHELRKELGAILASSQGIYAAKSVLRHAQISTTDAFYTDKKRTITAGLGALLISSAENVTSADFKEKSPKPLKTRKKMRRATA